MDIFVYDQFLYNRNLTDQEQNYASMSKLTSIDDLVIGKQKTSHEIPLSEENESDCECDTRIRPKRNVKSKKYSKYEKKAVVTLFGKLNSTQSIAIHVLNFQPCFYIKIPKTYQETPDKYLNKVKYELNDINTYSAHHNKNKPVVCLEKWIDSNGFTNNEMIYFVKLTFNNFRQMTLYGNQLKKIRIDKEKLDLYESRAYPYMRFLHDKNLSPVGYINISNYVNVTTEDRVTRCNAEIFCTYDDLGPSSKKDALPDLMIASFDIETAPLISGELFPCLDKGDPIIAIQLSFKLGSKLWNYVMLYGAVDLVTNDYTQIYCKTESEIIEKFSEMITFGPPDAREKGHDYSPNVIIGFNQNTYDWKYVHTRATELDIIDGLVKASKFINYQSRFISDDLSSKNIGKYAAMLYMDYPGIINIDQMRYFIKQNDVTLEQVSLKVVASNYLVKSEIKNSILDYVDDIKSKLKDDNFSSKFITKLESEYGSVKDTFTDSVDMFKAAFVEKMKKTSTENDKYDLDYQDMFNLVRKIKELNKDRESNLEQIAEACVEISKYSIQDCVLLHKLDKVRNIVVNTYIGANTNNILWKTMFICGSGVPLYSTVLKIAKWSNKKLVKDHFFDEVAYKSKFEKAIESHPEFSRKFEDICEKYSPEDKRYVQKVKKLETEFYKSEVIAGGYVRDPVPGSHANVATFDVNSEYPSIMMTHNLSFDTLVKDPAYDNLEGVSYTVLEWTTIDGETHKSKFVCHYESGNVGIQGILPQIINFGLKNRKDVVNQRKKYKPDTPEYNTLDAHQSALKILNNSVYGTTVDKRSRIACIDVGGSTTAQSRAYIIKCAEMVTAKITNATIIYGDTDSFFVRLDYPDLSVEESFKQCWVDSRAIEKMLNDYMQNEMNYKYMRIELEKIFSKLRLFNKKKNYFGKKHTSDDIKIFTPISMGVKYKKRDSSKIEKYVGFIVEEMVNADREDEIYAFVVETICGILNKKFDNSYFNKSCKYNPPYKNPERTMGHVIRNLISHIDPGNVPQVGERIFYTYLKPPNTQKISRSKLKKTDIAYPLKYITDQTIDYVIFIEYFVNNIGGLLESINYEKYVKLKSGIKML